MGEGQHSPRVAAALEALRQPERGYDVTDLAFRIGARDVSLIGIDDGDPERNLGDYQNVTYFLLSEGVRPVVVDPGLREGGPVREILGIEECDVVFSHFHLDHWIGYEPYVGQAFYASPVCRMVLAGNIGIEKTGKSIFFEGRLTDHHRRPTPTRAVNDAERLLPMRCAITEVTETVRYRHPDLGLTFFELPYGQTEGTLYGVLEATELKLLFASDLMLLLRGRAAVEPHYAFKPKERVIEDLAIVLGALLGEEPDESVPSTAQAGLRRLSSPDYVALGHGIIDFQQRKEEVRHLLEELQTLHRIEKEHVI